MRVLVTGGNGYIGSHVAGKLASNGYDVLATWRRERDRLSALEVDLEVEQLDILDSVMVNRLVRSFAPEAIVHTAALVTSRESVSELSSLVEANIAATSRLAAAACATDCSRFVFTSSISVYGARNASSSGCTEDDANPDSLYGWSKLVGEELLQHMAAVNTSFSPVSLRLAGVHGGVRSSGALYRFAMAALNNTPIEVLEPTSLFRWTFIDDVVQSIEKALLLSNSNRHRVFNIASADSFTLLQLVEKIVGITNSNSTISMPSDAPLRSSVMNIDRAINELGFSPTSLETGLKNYFEALRRTP